MMTSTRLRLRETGIMQRALLVLLLTALFFVLFIVTAKPAHAYTVSGTFVVNTDSDLSGVDSDLSVSMNLYGVGTFDRDSSGEAYLKLNDNIQSRVPIDIPLNIKQEDGKTEAEWTADWLNSAYTLSQYLNAQSEDDTLSPDKTFTARINESFTVEGLSNGLYLITGTGTETTIGGEKKYVWPQPMYVLVWNGNVTDIQIKPQIGSISEIRVVKTWSVDPIYNVVESIVRPDEIKIQLSYDGEQYGDLIELNSRNNWSYSDKVPKGYNDPSKWNCVEVDSGSNYFVKVSPGDIISGNSGDILPIEVTNTFAREKLVITKKIGDNYVKRGNNSTSFVFKIEGIKDDKVVFNKYAGIQFDGTDLEKSVTVVGIPSGLDSLEVSEVYSAGYKSSVSSQLKHNEDAKTYEISFENTDGDKTFGGGVINKYKMGEDRKYSFAGSEGYTH